MMPIPELFLALLILLLTPGPTNTLLALAGAERGVLNALRLIPAEAAAYLLTTVPLALVGAQLLGTVPALRSIITLAAAVWVAWLAVKMWQTPAALGGQPVQQVTAAKVFITTLLNPKALIIGLVLLPAESGLAMRAAVFVGLIAVAATTWAIIGSTMVRGSHTSRLPLIRRAGACWLAVLSLGLAGAGFSA